MDSRQRLLLIAGVVLDTAGATLIVFSLVKGDGFSWLGLGLVGAGSLLIVTWARNISWPQAAEEERPAEEAMKEWTPEPELTRPPPRPVKLTSLGRWRVILWTLALVVAVLYTGVLPRRDAPEVEVLERFGVETAATIHRKEIRSRPDGSKSYSIYYNFADQQGKGVRASATVAEDVYESLSEGDSLQVVYFPEDPMAHTVKGLDQDRPLRREGMIALIILAAAFIAQDFHRRRHKRLTSYGAPAPGVVTEVKRLGASFSFVVECTIHGQRKKLRGSERGSTVRRGDALTVLYLPQNPQRALLYRQSLYRAAA